MQATHPPLLLKVITATYFFLTILSLLFHNPAEGALYPLAGFFPFPSLPAPNCRPGEILIKFKAGTPPALIAGLSQRYALRQVSSSPYSGLQRVTATVAGDLVQALRQEPGVAFAEANFIRRTEEFIPNDPLYGLQWHLHANGLPLAWDLSTGQNVIVAVLDTGIAYENYSKFAQAPDLANTYFIPGWDFVNNDSHPNDDNRHGTHIAGIIAQSTNNLTGGAGVAFQCSLMPIKVLDDTGSGDVATIVDGIYYAVNNGAQIINMSYGSIVDPSATEEEAINYAVDHGVLVICSAGNEATELPHYPSSYPSAISVTAVGYDNQFASVYSNYGPDVDLAAPGGDLSLDLDGDGNPDGIYQQTHDGRNFRRFDFYYAEGTSSACAYATGVAALVLSRGGGKLSAAQTRQIMENTSIDMGTPGWDPYYGSGVLNPYEALLAVDALLSPPLAVTQGFLSPFSMAFQPASLWSQALYPAGIGMASSAYTGIAAPLITGIAIPFINDINIPLINAIAGASINRTASISRNASTNRTANSLASIINTGSLIAGGSNGYYPSSIIGGIQQASLSGAGVRLSGSQNFLAALAGNGLLSYGTLNQTLSDPSARLAAANYSFPEFVLSSGNSFAPAAGASSTLTYSQQMPFITPGSSQTTNNIYDILYSPYIAYNFGLLWPTITSTPFQKGIFIY
ncbi:MAG: S8 family peptidase [bacterium]